MYQCLVANKESSAQAVAELKLGGELNEKLTNITPLNILFMCHADSVKS